MKCLKIFLMTKYKLSYSKAFKKSVKKLSKNDLLKSRDIIEKLSNGETLDDRYKNHKLTGNFKDFYECHIKPDLLLIYKYNNNILELHLYNIGSHGNLFS